MRSPTPRAAAPNAVSAPERAVYAAHQAQLLDALLHGDNPPQGFAAAQADAAGRALRGKRARAVARAWPALAIDLGDTFGAHFDVFARATDPPSTAGPLADGLAFARSIAAKTRLGDEARAELLLARAALHRRAPFVRIARLREPQLRLLLVARLPWIGTIQHSVRTSRATHDAQASHSPAHESCHSAATPDRLQRRRVPTPQRAATPLASPPMVIHEECKHPTPGAC